MTKFLQQRVGHRTFWHDPARVQQVSQDYFSAQHWSQQNALSGSAAGRGTTHFIQYETQEWVLRRYQRGGLIGRLLNDEYLFLGLNNTRGWRELALLEALQTLNLPAPRPVAAMVERCGLYYRASLLTEKIAASRDGFELLQHSPWSEQQWRDVGRCIRRFHDHAVYHHDLNIHNIMLDGDNKIWLIDFDKCGFRPGEFWKPKNLARLKRSLQKEQKRCEQFYWQESDWDALQQGYNAC